MGILFFGDDLTPPSVLWMRRMLAALGDDVARLVTEADPGSEHTARYPTLVIRDGRGRLAWRIRRRLGSTAGLRRSGTAARRLAAAANAPDVSAVLIHYLTSAVQYDRAWPLIEKPVFVHCHGYDVTWDLRHPERPEERVHAPDYRERVRRLPGHVRFIANSHTAAGWLRDAGVGDGRIDVKYLGVEVPASPPARPDAPELTLLYLGRLIDCKGPDLLIEAFDLACARGLAARLLIAGDGPLMAACRAAKAAAASGEKIELLGAVDGAAGAALRARADVFTSHHRRGPQTRQEEAFGVSLVEAMAAALPVVSGRSGSLPEVVEDGVTGVLFEPGDVEAHAAALLRLAADPALRRRLGRSGWQRARERFTLARETATLRAILGLAPAAPGDRDG